MAAVDLDQAEPRHCSTVDQDAVFARDAQLARLVAVDADLDVDRRARCASPDAPLMNSVYRLPDRSSRSGAIAAVAPSDTTRVASLPAGPKSVTLRALKLAGAIGRVKCTTSGARPSTPDASGAGLLDATAGAAVFMLAPGAAGVDGARSIPAAVQTIPASTSEPAVTTWRAARDREDRLLMCSRCSLVTFIGVPLRD